MLWNRSASPPPDVIAAMQALQRGVSAAARTGDLDGAFAPMERLRGLALANPVGPEVCDTIGRACEDVANAAIRPGNLEAAQYGFDLCQSLLRARPADEPLMMHLAAVAWAATSILCDRGDTDRAAAYGNALFDLKPRSRDGCWQLQLWFTRCAARCIEAAVDKGNARDAARVAHQFRDYLMAPWFLDDMIAWHGPAKAEIKRTRLGSLIGHWYAEHPDLAAKGAGRVIEPYDFADEVEMPLWNGALRIALPRRYVPERQSAVRYVCDEPGIDCPTVSIEVASIASAVGRDPAEAALSAQGCLRTAVAPAARQYRHLKRELAPGLQPGSYAQYECEDKEDRTDDDGESVHNWLTARRWYLLRASRRTIFLLGIGVLSANFQEGRPDVQAFLAQLERAIGAMALDADRLCREARLD